MGFAYLAAGHKRLRFRHLHLTGMGTRMMDTLIKGDISAMERVECHGTQDVRRGGQVLRRQN